MTPDLRANCWTFSPTPTLLMPQAQAERVEPGRGGAAELKSNAAAAGER